MKKIIKRIVSCVLFVAILLGLLQVSSLIFQPKSNDKAAGIHYPRANGIFSEPKDSIDTVLKNKVRRLCSLKPMRFSENLILRM